MQQHMLATVITVVLIALVGMVMVGNFSHQTAFVASESVNVPTAPTSTAGSETTAPIEPLPGSLQCPKMTDVPTFYVGKGTDSHPTVAGKLQAATNAMNDCGAHKQPAVTAQEAEHNSNKAACAATNCLFAPAQYTLTPTGDKGCDLTTASLVVEPGSSENHVKIRINYAVKSSTSAGGNVTSVVLEPTGSNSLAKNAPLGWTFDAKGYIDYDSYSCDLPGQVPA